MKEQALLQDVKRYWAVIHKRRGFVLTSLGICMLVAVLYNYTTRPLYQATVLLLIERDTPNLLPTKEIVDFELAGDFQTQLELLKGRMLAERVVARLNLQKDAELSTGPLMSPWERFQRRFLGRPPASSLDSDGMLLSPAVAAFRSRLTVEPVRGTRLVKVRFNAYDPSLASQVANALAQVYIEQSLEFRYTASSEATGWLSDRLGEQAKKVKEAEGALQQYQERERLVNLEERQALVDQKLSTLNSAAMSARTERITKETLYNQLRSLSPSQLESFSLMLTNGVIQQLRSKLAELQSQRATLSETLGEKHPDMLKVNADSKATEEKLKAEMQNVIRSVEGDFRIAAQQEANLQANLEATKQEALDLNRKAIEYGVLKREADSNQQLFREIMNKTKASGLETELKSTSIRIVEKAEVPRSPISPRRLQNYQAALLLGLGLGIALCFLFEHVDNTFKTPEDVKAHLSIPFLGMVPEVSVRGASPTAPKPSPLTHKNPDSNVAEAYRVLRTNLLFSSASAANRTILVSSAGPGEGKTTTVANIAESLAQNGARVLVVDADLRRPTMHQHFGLQKTPGLSDLIVGKTQASQAIQTTRVKGLQVLPCGYIPPNPTELLGSTSMREVMSALRDHYDWVIVDTPPILAIADTPVLGPIVDGVVLVVGAEASSRPTVQRAIEQLTSVGSKMIGVVLNRVDLERNSYYYGQYYAEYYRSYYAEGTAPRRAAAAALPPGPRPLRRP